MMIVWSMRGKISELFCAVLCVKVVHNDKHTWAVLKDECWFRFNFLCICLGFAFCAFFSFSLHYFVLVLFALMLFCISFSFFSTLSTDFLRRTSPKWPVLCRVGCTRRPASADRTARRQFQATGQPVSRTQASDAMTSRPRYEAKCVQRRRFQCGSVPLRLDIKGTELPLPIYWYHSKGNWLRYNVAADGFYYRATLC